MIKPSMRLLFIVVLVFLAGAVLCFRMINIPGAEGHDDPSPVFNTTLLTFAAIDLSDDSLRQDVEHLLYEDFLSAKNSHQRSFLTAAQFHLDNRVLWSESKPFLQDWWSQRWFEDDIMSKMASKMTGLLSPGGKKYHTCAVVGNSGMLLQGSQGKTIDSHEFVIRINNARIVGFEQYVGSKTSLSFTHSDVLDECFSSNRNCFCHPYGQNVPIMMYISHPVHFVHYALCNSSHKAPLMITHPQFDVLCARIVKYYSVNRFLKDTMKPFDEWSCTNWGTQFHYSSGMQAIMLALGVCDKVGIFGFGKPDSARHHYHDKQKNESSLHDYQAEYDLYEDLVKRPEAIPFVSYKFNFKFPPVIFHR